MRMVILDGYTLNPGDLGWDAIRCLVDELIVYDRTPEDEIDERSKGADIIATNKVTVSARTIAHVSELKFIPVTATGFDMVDIKAAGERGIPVSNVPEYGTDSVAQYTFGLILEHCHRVGLHTDAVRDGEWKAAPDWCFWKTPQVLLKGKTMGIVGFGRIGRRVGELAHAFGLEILAYDVIQDSVQVGYPFSWSSLEDLFSRSDIVSMHCPLTPENTGVVNERTLSLMKKDAFFINNARGGLVNEKDLADALNRGKIAGAAVDVVSKEPILEDNPLASAKNCLITPHMAWGTFGARRKLMDTTAANVKAFLEGRPKNVVNAAYLK